MRLHLKDYERRPDPPAVQTDDRKAVLTGLVLWVAGLVTALLGAALFGIPLDSGVLWMCTAGIASGLALLVHTERRRRRTPPPPA